MQKPKYRHCNNCEYHEQIGSKYSGGGCLVKYKYIFYPRLKALFCRYYKEKVGV